MLAPALIFNVAPAGTVTLPTNVCEFLHVSTPLITSFPGLPFVSLKAETAGTNEIATDIVLKIIKVHIKKLRENDEDVMPTTIPDYIIYLKYIPKIV
ncbi:MAG: Uncharacterised protein [Methanobacteriota archaeon]|nr:MAG: Uncharacterised protein [Euryarchaeota archaeon]